MWPAEAQVLGAPGGLPVLVMFIECSCVPGTGLELCLCLCFVLSLRQSLAMYPDNLGTHPQGWGWQWTSEATLLRLASTLRMMTSQSGVSGGFSSFREECVWIGSEWRGRG